MSAAARPAGVSGLKFTTFPATMAGLWAGRPPGMRSWITVHAAAGSQHWRRAQAAAVAGASQAGSRSHPAGRAVLTKAGSPIAFEMELGCWRPWSATASPLAALAWWPPVLGGCVCSAHEVGRLRASHPRPFLGW